MDCTCKIDKGCLFKLVFKFDERVTAPWEKEFIVSKQTVENLENSWGPGAYLTFTSLTKEGCFDKIVFINSTDVVRFSADKIEKDKD